MSLSEKNPENLDTTTVKVGCLYFGLFSGGHQNGHYDEHRRRRNVVCKSFTSPVLPPTAIIRQRPHRGHKSCWFSSIAIELFLVVLIVMMIVSGIGNFFKTLTCLHDYVIMVSSIDMFAYVFVCVCGVRCVRAMVYLIYLWI